jgi:hypothetical protein
MKTHQILTAKGIPCTVVLDSAVGYIMERVDLVLVGSEAVVESGVSLDVSVLTHADVSGPCLSSRDIPSRPRRQSFPKTFLRPGRIIQIPSSFPTLPDRFTNASSYRFDRPRTSSYLPITLETRSR